MKKGKKAFALVLICCLCLWRCEGFHEKDGKAYCRKDYFDMFAPKCGGCARAILENYISALSSLWHPECFVCRVRSQRSASCLRARADVLSPIRRTASPPL